MSKIIYIKKIVKDTSQSLKKCPDIIPSGMLLYGKDDNSIKIADGEHTYVELPYLIGGGATGTTNYEELNNLPKINGHTIIGDKTASDYGIIVPTKMSDLVNDEDFVSLQEVLDMKDLIDQDIAALDDKKADKADTYTKEEIRQIYDMIYVEID